jgi:hypothetical protein
LGNSETIKFAAKAEDVGPAKKLGNKRLQRDYKITKEAQEKGDIVSGYFPSMNLKFPEIYG